LSNPDIHDTTTTQPIRRVRARAGRPTGGVWWLGPLIGVGVGLCGLIAIGLLIGLKPFVTAANPIRPTPLVITITPTPIVPTVTARPTATLPPTQPPSPTPEGLFISGNAIVAGTGSALRLRSDPGLQSTTLKTVSDGTRLIILEGPRDADGLTWWRLRDPVDGAEGWAAQNYLTPATTP